MLPLSLNSSVNLQAAGPGVGLARPALVGLGGAVPPRMYSLASEVLFLVGFTVKKYLRKTAQLHALADLGLLLDRDHKPP